MPLSKFNTKSMWIIINWKRRNDGEEVFVLFSKNLIFANTDITSEDPIIP